MRLEKKWKIGISTTKDYSNGKGKPFEIRCIIYRDCVRHADSFNLKSRLSQKEIDRISKYHFKNIFFGRHECVPKKTRMRKIATSEINELTGEEKKIFSFVPEEFYDRYLEDCEKYPDRQVEIQAKEPALKSWDLRGYNLEPEEIGKPEDYNAVEEINKYYQDVHDTSAITKLENQEMVSKILMSQGIDPNAHINIYLTKQIDKEDGKELYQLVMRDRKGNIKPVKLPVSDGEKKVVTNRTPMTKDENGNIIYSTGIERKSPLSWKLQDGTEINVLSENGKLQIGKTFRGMSSVLESKALMNREVDNYQDK